MVSGRLLLLGQHTQFCSYELLGISAEIGHFLYNQEKCCIASQVDGNCRTNENSYPRGLLQFPFPISISSKRQFSPLMYVSICLHKTGQFNRHTSALTPFLRLQAHNTMDKSNLIYQTEHIFTAASCSLLRNSAIPRQSCGPHAHSGSGGCCSEVRVRRTRKW